MGSIRIFILASLCLSAVSYADRESLAPQIGVRLSSGSLTNQGTNKGSTFTLGAINPNFYYFLSPAFALGIGYWADLNISGSSLPLSGFDFSTRYFVMGQGTRSRWTDNAVTHERVDKFSLYVGVDLSQRNYYITSEYTTKTSTPITGNYADMSLSLGTMYSISSDLNLNAEINYAVFTFASSDPRFRIQATLFNLGIAYLW